MVSASCHQEDVAIERGHIVLRLSTDDAVSTRALQDVSNVETWHANVSNESETLYDGLIGNGLETMLFDAGVYAIDVRNYDTMADANNASNGWGAAYHEGSASNVLVSAGGTAYVNISCGRALNAKFRLDYSEFSGVIDGFAITVPRTITFSHADGTLANEAFFAPNATITYTITYTIAGETKTTTARTLTLGGAATVSTLRIKSDIHGQLSISLTCDNEFEGDAQSDITIDGASGK